jgi:hypothetical protein
MKMSSDLSQSIIFALFLAFSSVSVILLMSLMSG